MADELRDVFNQIAPSWYNFRHHTIFRRELEELAEEGRGGKLLNLGCGHGADFLPFVGKFECYGIDFSEEMVKFARKYAEKYRFTVNLAVADVSQLPFQNASFDCAISVATYHHLKTEQRLPALQELKRVLKPGGTAFITVWNHYQVKFWFRGRDVMVPWRTKEKTLYRYYHLFSYSELINLARQAGFEVVKAFPESNYRFPAKCFSRNICLLLKRLDSES